MDFQDLRVKNGGFREKIGKGWGDIDPQLTLSYFGDLHVCVQFGENRRRNATVRVSTDGQTHTHTHTHAQMQNDFIICPMLYAIAMGQIINKHRK